MYLKKISIINYKNINEAEINLSQKINCFIGLNGAGKTNILDTVYYLSFCKSHSNSIDSQNIQHNCEFFVLHGHYSIKNNDTEIYCGLKRKQKKHFKKDKKEYDKLSDHIGLLPLVIISTSDSELILGGSEERRKFIDGFISQYDKRYLESLLNYNKALQQRNSLIKSEQIDDIILEIWEEKLALYGEYIFRKRIEFIDNFTPIFQEFYDYISKKKENISIKFKSQLQDGMPLIDLLKHSRNRDLIIGYTTKGVHRDDLEMQLDDFPIKRVGSQGQNKTMLIALKLAQFDFLKQITGIRPILLFDDIFDKLDSERVEQIINLLNDERFGQIFISDTNREYISKILKDSVNDYKIFNVENGKISYL